MFGVLPWRKRTVSGSNPRTTGIEFPQVRSDMRARIVLWVAILGMIYIHRNVIKRVPKYFRTRKILDRTQQE